MQIRMKIQGNGDVQWQFLSALSYPILQTWNVQRQEKDCQERTFPELVPIPGEQLPPLLFWHHSRY